MITKKNKNYKKIMNSTKIEIFLEIFNYIYETFAENPLKSLSDLRKRNILLSLIKEM